MIQNQYRSQYTNTLKICRYLQIAMRYSTPGVISEQLAAEWVVNSSAKYLGNVWICGNFPSKAMIFGTLIILYLFVMNM